MVSYVFLIVFGDQVTWNVKPNNTGVFSQQSWESHVFFLLNGYIILTRWYTYLWFGQVHWIHRKSGLLLGIVIWRIANHCKPLKKVTTRYCPDIVWFTLVIIGAKSIGIHCDLVTAQKVQWFPLLVEKTKMDSIRKGQKGTCTRES